MWDSGDVRCHHAQKTLQWLLLKTTTYSSTVVRLVSLRLNCSVHRRYDIHETKGLVIANTPTDPWEHIRVSSVASGTVTYIAAQLPFSFAVCRSSWRQIMLILCWIAYRQQSSLENCPRWRIEVPPTTNWDPYPNPYPNPPPYLQIRNDGGSVDCVCMASCAFRPLTLFVEVWPYLWPWPSIPRDPCTCKRSRSKVIRFRS